MIKARKTLQYRVTIKDIAAMAKVSIGTVDRVLHNRGEVNQETHDRVMSFVDELGYTPNLLAKSLALKKRFSIAALLPEGGNSNPYWKKPLDGFKRASQELSDFNTRIEIFHYDAGEEQSFNKEFIKMLSANPDGIIMAPNFHDSALKHTPVCQERNIPCMLIDNNIDDGFGLAYFGQDAFQSGVVAAKLMHYGLPEQSKVLILNIARNKAITRHMQRRESGFISYFEYDKPGHDISISSHAVDLSDKKEPCATLKKLLKENRDTAGVFVTNSRVHKVANCFSGSKGNIIIAGYDLVDANVEFLKKGVIDFLIGQKPEEQGYKSAMAMFDYLLSGKLAERVNYSAIDIITKENIDYYK
jgi:LacI family transcriptional regulator